jgi:hypothetical protein
MNDQFGDRAVITRLRVEGRLSSLQQTLQWSGRNGTIDSGLHRTGSAQVRAGDTTVHDQILEGRNLDERLGKLRIVEDRLSNIVRLCNGYPAPSQIGGKTEIDFLATQRS